MAIKNIVLNVEGMSCGHCEKRILQALDELPGIEGATVSLAEKTVSVYFDTDAVGETTIAKTIEEQGYDVIG